MSNQITMKQIESLVAYLNAITDSPAEPYTQQPDGTYKANAGNFHIDGAYGGHRVVRMCENGGIDSRYIDTGFVSKKELYKKLSAFVAGVELGKGK